MIVIVCSSYTCNKSSTEKLKGKLVIKELCSHYVVQVVQGKVDTSMVINNWKDEKEGRSIKFLRYPTAAIFLVI